MMSKLKLTVNETKTRLCHLPDETFDFLGYAVASGFCVAPQTAACWPDRVSSGRRSERLCREIGELTTRKKAGRAVEVQMGGSTAS